MEDTAENVDIQDPEVLPREGVQPFLDVGSNILTFAKNHAISLAIGIAIGVLLTHWIDKKGKL